MLGTLPANWTSTRSEMQRVAVHVLARRRAALSGKIGLRASPGGIGTPAAGPEHEVLRVSGTWLLRERTGAISSSEALSLLGATLAQAATFADVDLDGPLDVGHDSPSVGDPDALLAIDPAAVGGLSAWFGFGWEVLDAATASTGRSGGPSVVQLWPEHFDAGCDVAAGTGRTNLGASPGDASHDAPYLYVGPWDERRPGDGSYWNAPFGAMLPYDEVRNADDPRAVAIAFLQRGVELLAAE